MSALQHGVDGQEGLGERCGGRRTARNTYMTSSVVIYILSSQRFFGVLAVDAVGVCVRGGRRDGAIDDLCSPTVLGCLQGLCT